MISFRVLLINCSLCVTVNELIAKTPWGFKDVNVSVSYEYGVCKGEQMT